jgi:hypothetical protein
MSDLQKLTEIFTNLGAPDPASWARSEIDENILRYLPLLEVGVEERGSRRRHHLDRRDAPRAP